MPKFSTLAALEAASKAIAGGIPPVIVTAFLIKDGFQPNKAQIIVRWAKRNKN